MTVRHHQGQYDIDFVDWETCWRSMPQNSVIMTDSNVRKAVEIPGRFRVIEVPAGESSKSTEHYSQVTSQLAQLQLRRDGTLIGLGGGVVGDLAGFAAATYMRGIDFYQVPTSLLAMVDSSIGGKVGINLPEGKNLLGAFYPPKRVLIVHAALDTLPEREFKNGLGEILKMGFIRDKNLLQLIRSSHSVPNFPLEIVQRSLEGKKEVVEADEFETTGERATLNFGHTVGHAIEKLAGYENIAHGEAVAIGMVVESELGEALSHTIPGTTMEVRQTIEAAGLPTDSEYLSDVDSLIQAMSVDKKASKDGLAFSFLTGVGSCKLIRGVNAEEVANWLRAR